MMVKSRKNKKNSKNCPKLEGFGSIKIVIFGLYLVIELPNMYENLKMIFEYVLFENSMISFR